MKRGKKNSGGAALATQLRNDSGLRFGGLQNQISMGGVDAALYRGMRCSIPLLDASVEKLVRLVGGFSVRCSGKGAQSAMDEFVRAVPTGRGQAGLDSFLTGYLDSMLTYGRAVGEIIASPRGVEAVMWGDVTKIQLQEGDSPLDITLWGPDKNGTVRPLPRQELLLFTPLKPEVGAPYGVSLFRSMPFLAEILMRIYETVGKNWERAGNIRYSVVYRPGNQELDQGMAEQRSQVMASQWAAAMSEGSHGAVRDFVAVGDVDIKVIGADGQILDAEVPVRQILEQLVAKTGLPPFLLGLSWSSTERLSQQQADMLTSELWALRRAVTPVLEKICRLFLRLGGYGGNATILWEDISLQDMVEEAKTELYHAQADKVRKEIAHEDQ